MRNTNPMVAKCRHSKTIYNSVIQEFGYPNSIIELGCGNGGNLKEFSNSYRIGIDPCLENIEKAEKILGKNAILGDHKNLYDFTENFFSVGITCSVFDHMEQINESLQQFIKICENVFLLEPVAEKGRQATKKDTYLWKCTWYHDYEKILNNINIINHSIIKFPLYERGSGPRFCKIIVKKSKT